MKNKNGEKRGIGGIALLGCFIVAVALFIGCVFFLNATTAKEPTTKILLATTDIAENTTITKNDFKKYFKLVEVNTVAIPKGVYTSYEELNKVGNFIVTVKMNKNEMLMNNKMLKESAIENSYENRVEVSFKVIEFTDAVCGTIRKGDHISISVTNVNGQETVLFEDVYVSTVTTNDGVIISNNDKESVATGFNIYIEKADLTFFNENINNGTVLVTKVK